MADNTIKTLELQDGVDFLELQDGTGPLLLQYDHEDWTTVPVAWLAINGAGGWEAQPGG